jgi:hypothetical protein
MPPQRPALPRRRAPTKLIRPVSSHGIAMGEKTNGQNEALIWVPEKYEAFSWGQALPAALSAS